MGKFCVGCSIGYWVAQHPLDTSAQSAKPALGYNDPLFRYHQWKANLRILETTEIETVPYTPVSHPFVERLIGTVRRECLDQLLFWTANDLEGKLSEFQRYYNMERVHA